MVPCRIRLQEVEMLIMTGNPLALPLFNGRLGLGEVACPG